MQNELVIFEEIKKPELFTKDGSEKFCEKIKTQFGGMIFDISTKKGQDECRSAASMICSFKTSVDKERTQSTESLRAKVKEINSFGQNIVNVLQELQDSTRKPLTEFEEAEKSRIKTREERIAQINLFYGTRAFNNVSDVKKMLADLQTLRVFDWQEFDLTAQEIAERAERYLQDELAKGIKFEAEQKELAELRAMREEKEKADAARLKAEHEEKLKAEAAEKAKKEAEEAAAKAIANAELRAKEAERLGREAAEQAAQKERAKIEAERLAAEKAENARKQNDEYKKKIYNEIMTSLVVLMDEKTAKVLVKAIATGNIPHITIKY
jgi:hypothetical protein